MTDGVICTLPSRILSIIVLPLELSTFESSTSYTCLPAFNASVCVFESESVAMPPVVFVTTLVKAVASPALSL